MKNLKGSLILLLTAFIWGSTFVAQTTGAEHVGTFTFNAARSFVGTIFLIIVIGVKDRINTKKDTDTRNDDWKQDSSNTKWPVRGGIICGIVLFFAMTFQQLGISMYPENAAAAGRAGFVTATYVVLVAVVEQLRGKKINPIVGVAVLGTIYGMYLLCMSGGISQIYVGDIMVFACAICYTLHILVVDYYKNVDSFKLSCMQFLTCGIISALVCIVREKIVFNDIRLALFSILYAGILSSGVAYTMQMIGQKYTKPAVASIVMSLESVFAVLTGWIVLNEVMSTREKMGCVLVFASVILAQLPELFSKDKK